MKTTIVVGGLMALALSRPGEALAQTSVARADQSDIRFVSAFVAPGRPVPGECRAEAHIFAESLVRYPGPNSWHWVLVCDEASWQRFLRLSGREGRDDIYASTDLEARTTYLSGAKLLYSNSFCVGPDEIIAHEIAHIRLHSEDEAVAEGLAHSWAKQISRKSARGTTRN